MDDTESGALAAEFVSTDPWGGEDIAGVITQHIFGGLGGKTLGVNDTVLWSYTTDLAATYTDLVAAYQATDGSTVLPSGGVSVRRFGTKCTITTAAGTGFPNGAYGVWKGNKEPPSRWRWEFRVLFDSEAEWEVFETNISTLRDQTPRPLLTVGANTYYTYVDKVTMVRTGPYSSPTGAAPIGYADLVLVRDR